MELGFREFGLRMKNRLEPREPGGRDLWVLAGIWWFQSPAGGGAGGSGRDGQARMLRTLETMVIREAQRMNEFVNE